MKSFQQARWASYNAGKESLESMSGSQHIAMYGSDATAVPLVLDNSGEKNFGADLIRFGPREKVALHEHTGAHILLVTKGEGVLTYHFDTKEETHQMYPGMIYLIPSNTPHSILATTELVLVAVGNDHQSAGSPNRLNLL